MKCLIFSVAEDITTAEKEWKLQFHEWSTKYIVDWKIQYDSFMKTSRERCGETWFKSLKIWIWLQLTITITIVSIWCVLLVLVHIVYLETRRKICERWFESLEIWISLQPTTIFINIWCILIVLMQTLEYYWLMGTVYTSICTSCVSACPSRNMCWIEIHSSEMHTHKKICELYVLNCSNVDGILNPEQSSWKQMNW